MCFTLPQGVISYFKNENWINPFFQVQILKRQVLFEETADDTVAEVYLHNKSVDSKIIKLFQDKKVCDLDQCNLGVVFYYVILHSCTIRSHFLRAIKTWQYTYYVGNVLKLAEHNNQDIKSIFCL